MSEKILFGISIVCALCIVKYIEYRRFEKQKNSWLNEMEDRLKEDIEKRQNII